ncbi:MAG TPA: polysaccharide biosynthesis tyrosine autokinase [Candidatus Sulfotelmatobacter sp.]|nr:polysaccharide biosynthesis tyrosine autokinase [Candidatus Sulfotelmatobacter sp.]
MTLQLSAPPLMPLGRQPADETEADGISLGQVFGVLWRRRVLLLSAIIGITLGGFLVVKSLTPAFTSTAIVVVSARPDNIVNLEDASLQTAESDGIIRSEVDALTSRTLVDRVIDRENLMDDPEFNIYARPFRPNLLTRLGVVDYLPAVLQHYVRSKPLDPSRLTPAQLKYNVATMVMKAYDVSSDAKTYSVKVSFTSIDAEKAARIANAFVEEYMKTQVDDQIAASDKAAAWLNPKLAELSKKVADTSQAVEDFRAQHHIINLPAAQPEGNTLALQEVQNLAQDLSTARTTRANAEAAEREMQQLLKDPGNALSAPVVAQAPVVENVRIQEVTEAAHLAELRGTYGEKHHLVQEAEASLKKLRERLKQEVRRATQQLDVQMHQAESTEARLQAQMNKLTARRNGENSAMPRLAQLEADAASAVTIYNTFVQGYYRAITQDGVPMPKGRIVQRADVSDAPSFPNVPAFMAVIFLVAVIVAVGTVYGMEARDKTFRSARALEEAVQVPVLGLTLLAPGRLRRLMHRHAPVSQQLLAKPTSAMSEAVRLVRTAIATSDTQHPPKVVMVTSAVPGEGKTSFALMLARLSALAGKRVLVIEAEMRKPTFGVELNPLPERGLTEFLVGRASLDEIIGVDKASGAHFIAVRKRSRFASELLASPQMKRLMDEVTPKYDLVVVDTPPVTIVADALELGYAIDAAVLVVKWGGTPRHLVAQAVRLLRAARMPLIGTVMSQVDAERYGSYGEGALPYDYAKTYYAGS